MAVISTPGRKKTTATIDAISEETDGLMVQAGGTIALFISGTYTGTIQLQRSFDGGASYLAVEDYAATGASNTQKDIIVSAGLVYKLASTAWTSGSAEAGLLSSS